MFDNLEFDSNRNWNVLQRMGCVIYYSLEKFVAK